MPESETLPITRSTVQKLLNQKYFIALPYEMMLWVFRMPVAPSAQKVFLLHLHTATVQSSKRKGDQYISELSVSLIADALDMAQDTVNKAHKALADHGVISRKQRKTDDDREVTALTHLRIPLDNYRQLIGAPNRQKVSEPVDQPAGEGTDAASAPATGSDSEKVTRLDQKIAEGQKKLTIAIANQKEASRYNQDEEPAAHLARVSEADRTVDSIKRGIEQLQGKRSKALKPSKLREESKPGLPRGCTLAHPRNQLTREQEQQLRNAIAPARGISNPKELIKEVVHQLTAGIYGCMPFTRALHVVSSIVIKGNWRTPIGYSHS